MSIHFVSVAYFAGKLAGVQAPNVSAIASNFVAVTALTAVIPGLQRPQLLVGILQHVGPSAPATVPTYDQFGQPSGVGPAADPNGVFFGYTNLNANQIWWISNQSGTGVTVTALAGGRFTWVPIGLGQQTFQWTLQDTVTLITSTGSKTFTS